MPSESLSPSEPVVPPPPPDPVEQLYHELESKIREYRPKDDLAPLERAFRFARQWHEGQRRSSGEPYMVHPLSHPLRPWYGGISDKNVHGSGYEFHHPYK